MTAENAQNVVTTAAVAIEALDVHRVYRLDGVEVAALRGVSLRIEEGEYVAITGPSGSGKSTLMHLLGCLDRPSAGSLLIGGSDITKLGDAELARLRNESIGFVFQSFQLLARTSALDNVALPLVYRGVGRGERRRRATAALEAVHLGHRLGHRPTQLSGGEQQRVAIARALVGEPRVLLADEPTGNLDTVNGEQVMAILEELNRERGVAVVLVTHEAEIAARARRLIRIRDGLVVEDLVVEDTVSGIAQIDTEIDNAIIDNAVLGDSVLGESVTGKAENG
ncbi:MAG TPA: ABC transporter ATP-binding protein [Actinocrinis sp.]|uniref:ABC transporter ATP-binding protein n=1 Tax=Actinocrinis sp. TaxID=1920516 RepID=UPI002DDD01F6|nr:ABC transporter ATP-binding protein [Actinocrinis sp.]HEV2345089.1 ABC transporter ATP-binding protein [Actinocrinis sp.]